jgi:cobalt-zinc-cadmium resistance protein CzcA
LDTALKNNLQLRSNDLGIERARTAANGGTAFPKTGIFTENEDLTPQDNRGILKIGLSQNLEWPGLYKAQKTLLQQQVLSREAERSLRELEVKRSAQLAYYQIWYLQSRQQLWQRLDSIYSSFTQAAVLMVKTGESAGLDSIAASARGAEIRVQLNTLQTDIESAQENLKRILNTATSYLPPLQPLEKIALSFVADSSGKHPLLVLQQQNINIAEAQIKVAQQSNKPNFDGRVFSQRLYGISNPFSGFSVTVGVPLFGKTYYKNGVKGAQQERTYQQSVMDYEKLSLTTAYKQALQQFQKSATLLTYYETTGLASADAIIKAANLAYRGGEIGFPELAQFITQATDIQRTYLEVLNEYNQAAIELRYYLGS